MARKTLTKKLRHQKRMLAKKNQHLNSIINNDSELSQIEKEREKGVAEIRREIQVVKGRNNQLMGRNNELRNDIPTLEDAIDTFKEFRQSFIWKVRCFFVREKITA